MYRKKKTCNLNTERPKPRMKPENEMVKTQWREISFYCRAAGLTLHDRVRSLIIQEKVELLRLHIQKSQYSRFRSSSACFLIHPTKSNLDLSISLSLFFLFFLFFFLERWHHFESKVLWHCSDQCHVVSVSSISTVFFLFQRRVIF